MADPTDIARTCLHTLATHGTDRYGRVHAPIWCGSLHVDTLQAPRASLREPQDWPIYEALRRGWLEAQLDGSGMYSSNLPDGEGRRAIRVSQRGFGCANLYYDQPLLRAARLLRAADADADAGRDAAVAAAVDAYIGYYLDHFVDPQTGLLEWGWHIDYDVHEDAFVFPDGHHHEIQILLPDWPQLHALRPAAVQRQMEQMAAWHIDLDRAVFGRHPDKGGGCSFAMAGGEFCLAFAFQHAVTGQDRWRRLAEAIPAFHFEQRHPRSGLIANRISGEPGAADRFDFHTADTSTVALWAGRVLMAGELIDSEGLRGYARQVLLAWARHGWDAAADRPYGLLNLDGTPVDAQRPASGYERQMPQRHLDLWTEYVMGYEYPYRTALTFLMGYACLQEDELLEAARRWADCYRRALPARDGRGTFCQGYGQLLSLFTYLAELTGDGQHLATAEQIADEALDHLWTGRILRGYPRKAWYESVDGPGYLVQGLIELGRAQRGQPVLRGRPLFDWNL